MSILDVNWFQIAKKKPLLYGWLLDGGVNSFYDDSQRQQPIGRIPPPPPDSIMEKHIIDLKTAALKESQTNPVYRSQLSNIFRGDDDDDDLKISEEDILYDLSRNVTPITNDFYANHPDIWEFVQREKPFEKMLGSEVANFADRARGIGDNLEKQILGLLPQ